MLCNSEKPAKRVKFSNDAKDDPKFVILNKPSITKLRKEWLQHSCKNEYIQLKQKIEEYYQRGGTVESFFLKEGRLILSWALIDTANIDALNFIIEQVPKDLIKTILQENHYRLLRSFLSVENSLAEGQEINSTQVQDRIQKIKLLEHVDQVGVSMILNECLHDMYLGASIKNSIIEVYKNYKETYPSQLKPKC